MSTIQKELLTSFTPDLLKEKVKALGLKAFVANQILDWVYQKYVHSFFDMKNLSKSAQELLDAHFLIQPIHSVQTLVSEESAIKFVGKLQDDQAIEFVVLIQEGYHTLCVSSQCGCPVDCKFCLTGYAGFKRNLSAGEIVAQILYAMNSGYPIRNLVFMGMGEPLLNYDALKESIDILTAPWGFDIGRRKYTISTSGFLKTIQQLIDDQWYVNLAFSVGSTVAHKRAQIMPVEIRNPIVEVSRLIYAYQQMHNRQLTLEYTLLKGVNDQREDIDGLISLAKYLNAKVNLINLNPHFKIPFQPIAVSSLKQIQRDIQNANVYATIRYRKGQDVAAACGQLGESLLYQDGRL